MSPKKKPAKKKPSPARLIAAARKWKDMKRRSGWFYPPENLSLMRSVEAYERELKRGMKK